MPMGRTVRRTALGLVVAAGAVSAGAYYLLQRPVPKAKGRGKLRGRGGGGEILGGRRCGRRRSRPKPWDPVDPMGVGRHTAWARPGTRGAETLRALAVERFGAEVA